MGMSDKELDNMEESLKEQGGNPFSAVGAIFASLTFVGIIVASLTALCAVPKCRKGPIAKIFVIVSIVIFFALGIANFVIGGAMLAPSKMGKDYF